MFKNLYCGFDTLDVAFAGALPIQTLKMLEDARGNAEAQQTPILLRIGYDGIDMHVYGHGMRGGYAYVTDTGPLGGKWMFKNNSDPRQWNIFASPSATQLLAFGYRETRDQLFITLKAMGAQITNHSINRADYAMDFLTSGFTLNQNQFVAHSHTKVSSHWGDKMGIEHEHPISIFRGRHLESVTIGKQPGRQIIVYDKKREAIEKQKRFWFDAWGINPLDSSSGVWRIEVRAGKKELKEKYKIRNFDDFENSIGDVIVKALDDVRYLADGQCDSNVTRQNAHSLWLEAQAVASIGLIENRSGLQPNHIIETQRSLAMSRYINLCVGNAIGLGVSIGLSDQEMIHKLPEIISEKIREIIKSDLERFAKSMMRAQSKLHFICSGLSRHSE